MPTNNLKLCVFAYNFPHKKTQEGLYKLIQHGIKIDYVISADPIVLNIVPSKTRVGVKDLQYEHPKDICLRFNIPYIVLAHNSIECDNFLQELKPDLGIILGSRILKEHIINKFSVGIINMHPGILPDNRGLDNIKWAVLNNLKQGVTAHLIDKNIDRGFLIEKSVINVYEDDSLVDIFLRIQNRELSLMVSSVQKILSGNVFNQRLEKGTYFKAMSDEEDNLTLTMFEAYKKNYNAL